MPARSLRGRNILDLKPNELQELRGQDLGMIFQEPMTRLNPLMRITAHFEEVLRSTSRICQEEAQGAALEPCAGWASRRRATASTRTSSPADAPADHDRADPRAAARGHRRRRANNRARRPRRGADPAHPRRPAAQLDTALLLITHNLGIVAEACDRIAVMYAGVSSTGPGTTSRPTRRTPTTRAARSTISLSTTELTRSRARRRTSWTRRRLPLPPALPGRDAGLRRQWPPTITVGTAAARSAGCTARRHPRGPEAPLEREAIAVAEEA